MSEIHNRILDSTKKEVEETRVRERRKEPRRKEENQGTLLLSSGRSWPNGQKSIQALTQDISTGGIRILCDVRVPINTGVKIKLALSRTHKLLNLEGQVRWINPVYEEELFEMGIEFIHVSPQKAMLLLKHVYGDTRSFDFD
jgi:hypothetical protein